MNNATLLNFLYHPLDITTICNNAIVKSMMLPFKFRYSTHHRIINVYVVDRTARLA